MFMDFKGVLNWLMKEKKTSIYFGSLIVRFESIIDITKKVPSLVSFIVSIVFNQSFKVKNHIYWICEWDLGSEESSDWKTMFSEPS